MSAHHSLTLVLALLGQSTTTVPANPFIHEKTRKMPTTSWGIATKTQQRIVQQPNSDAQTGAKSKVSPLPEVFEQQPNLVNPAALNCAKATAKSAYSTGSTGTKAKSTSDSKSEHSLARGSKRQATPSIHQQADTVPKQTVSWMSRLFGKRQTYNLAKTTVKEEREGSGNREASYNIETQTVVSEAAQEAPKSKQPVTLTQSQSKLVNRAFATGSQLDSVEATAAEEGPIPAATPFHKREKIIFRPTVVEVNRYGQPVLRPNVQLASQQIHYDQNGVNGSSDSEQLPPGEAEVVIPDQWSAPIVDGPYEQYGEQCGQCAPRPGPFQELCCRIRARLNGPCSPEPGIGTERVIQAISFIDTTQPQNNFRLRMDAAYNYESPDRAEYFWAKINGRGPSGRDGETGVDYQDLRAYMEIGGKKFSVGTDLPIRILAPDIYENTSGIGDINITTKTVFLDGKQWQLTNLLRTYIPSGDAGAGLGVGHASIEPGFAGRYKWSDVTYLHGDLKYWIPLGADLDQGGQALIYGIGMSHVWRDSDSFAVMPTLELVGYSFFDGQVTPPGIIDSPIDIDGLSIVNIHPGIRWVWDHGSDCGVKELGLFGGFSMTSDSLYEEMLRLEYRWTW
jgi:hypothetical protein